MRVSGSSALGVGGRETGSDRWVGHAPVPPSPRRWARRNHTTKCGWSARGLWITIRRTKPRCEPCAPYTGSKRLDTAIDTVDGFTQQNDVPLEAL